MELTNELNELLSLLGQPSINRKRFYTEVVKMVARLCKTSMNSFYLRSPETKRLYLKASIGLPKIWTDRLAVVNISSEPGNAACGLAAATRQVVVAADLTSSVWNGYRDLAERVGLQSVWSYPLVDDEEELIGTFASYSTDPKAPTRKEVHQVAVASKLILDLIRFTDFESSDEQRGT